MRDERGVGLTLAEFKQLVRDQFFMLLLDEERALAAIPAMLAADRQEAARIVSDMHRVIEVVGLKTKAAKTRFAEIESTVRSGRGGPRCSDVERPARRFLPVCKRGTSPRSRMQRTTARLTGSRDSDVPSNAERGKTMTDLMRPDDLKKISERRRDGEGARSTSARARKQEEERSGSA